LRHKVRLQNATVVAIILAFLNMQLQRKKCISVRFLNSTSRAKRKLKILIDRRKAFAAFLIHTFQIFQSLLHKKNADTKVLAFILFDLITSWTAGRKRAPSKESSNNSVSFVILRVNTWSCGNKVETPLSCLQLLLHIQWEQLLTESKNKIDKEPQINSP
jgi:hypothetical protein